jgi:hypothetical protein
MATAAFRRFSSFGSRRTAVLGLVAAGTVAAAIVVSLPHGQSPQRKALVAYIDAVDNVQARMRFSLTKALDAYNTFVHEKTVTPRTLAQLGQAETTVASLRRQLAALPAPPEAGRLRAEMLRLVSGEAAITREVHQLALFVSPFGAAVQRVQSAGTALGKALAAIKSPTPHQIRGTKKQIAAARRAFTAASDRAAAAEADAVDSYDAVVASTLARLHDLSAPPALAPVLRSEVAGLEATHRAGQRLARELRMKNRSTVAALGRAFTVATRRSQSVASQRAEIAAVKAYNARVHHLSAGAAAVQREVARLQQSVR